jgi:hypothetical protein
MSDEPIYVLIRPDGVKSKLVSRRRIVEMFRAGSIPDGSHVRKRGVKGRMAVRAFISKRRKHSGRSQQSTAHSNTTGQTLPAVIASPAPDDNSTERMIEDFGLTAGEVRQFLSGIPFDSIALEGPLGAGVSSVRQFEESLAELGPHDLVLDASGRCVLCGVRQTRTSLTARYASAFQNAVRHLLQNPSELPEPDFLQVFFDLAGKFTATHSAGIGYVELRKLLVDYSQTCNSASLLTDVSEWSQILFTDPLEILQKAVTAWEQPVPTINTYLVTTVDGFGGTLKNLFASALVNGLIDGLNEEMEVTHNKSVATPIAEVATKMAVIQIVVANRLRRLRVSDP